MSRPQSSQRLDITEPKICEFCGTYITEPDQRCDALADGRCES